MNIPSNPNNKSALNVKVIGIIVAVIVAVGAVGAYVATKGSTSASGPVVAKIDGKAVTLDEANTRLQILQRQSQQGQQPQQKLNFADLTPDAKQAVIREEAAHRLLVKDARKEKVITSEKLEQEKEVFEENLLQKLILERIANAAVSEESIKAAYEKEVSKIRGQQEIRARHILVKTQEDALKVKELLDTKSFKDVAKEMSLDQKTAKAGGDLGVLYTGNMVKEFEEALSKLKPGETSDPVKSEFGWHVIKLDSKAPAKILSYDQAKSKVAVEISKEAIKKRVDELLTDVKIEIL